MLRGGALSCRRLLRSLTRGPRNTRSFNNEGGANSGRYGDKAKADPESVIRQFESGATPSSDASVAEYVKALVYTNRLDENALMRTLRRGAEAVRGGGAASSSLPYAAVQPPPLRALPFGAAAAGAEAIGTETRPLYMQMLEPTFKAQLWRTARTLGTAFVVLSAVGALMDEKGGPMRGMLGSTAEPKPNMESNTKFADVKGVDEAKAELEEIVAYLKDPKRFTALGGKLPKGVLLVGPPGTGKTMLAKAVAGEAGVPFFYASGSEFEEMFVGVGARRVRELFAAAKKSSPCIIFLDEIDAIGSARNPRDQSYMKMTLNQLLVELDGFKANEGIICIAATNFPESLDKALIRPGRFDRHVVVPNPDVEGRRQILETHLRAVKVASDVDLKTLARGCPGFSGADLANLVNVAALRAAMQGKTVVGMADLEYAKDRVMMGAERRSAVISEENRRLTAYHEGGHALVALYTAGAHPVHKATIVPRGMSLGMVMQLPDKDETSVTRRQLLAKLDVCMGGRVAEELIFGEAEVTTGASSDLQQATRLARDMVTKYGMGRGVGLVSQNYEDEGRSISSETRNAIETEVKLILQEAHDRAAALLRAHVNELHLLASKLLSEETLSGAEIKELVAKNAASGGSAAAKVAAAAVETLARAKAAAKSAGAGATATA